MSTKTYDFVILSEPLVHGSILAKDWLDLERKMRGWHPHQWVAKERSAVAPLRVYRREKAGQKTG